MSGKYLPTKDQLETIILDEIFTTEEDDTDPLSFDYNEASLYIQSRLPEIVAEVIDENFTKEDGQEIVKYLNQIGLVNRQQLYTLLERSEVAANPEVVDLYLNTCETQDQKRLLMLIPSIEKDETLTSLILIHSACLHGAGMTDHLPILQELSILINNNLTNYLHLLILIHGREVVENLLTVLLQSKFHKDFVVAICENNLLFRKQYALENVDRFLAVVKQFGNDHILNQMNIIIPSSRTVEPTIVGYSDCIINCLRFDKTPELEDNLKFYISQPPTQVLPIELIKDELLYTVIDIIFSGIIFTDTILQKLSEVEVAVENLRQL